ncbi:RMR1-like protein [Kluyveromyces marxianus]|uniref:Protein RMR1 n=1 Tax=Kluyveromyces marxianus TaxID=4911 RepID=A0ABX6F194_KLUMA|nr:protein RMR1 [Kluyveromyces marxianus]BAP73139.1 hypothetical protein KMAR_60400 [Kluyveromyces marxianus]
MSEEAASSPHSVELETSAGVSDVQQDLSITSSDNNAVDSNRNVEGIPTGTVQVEKPYQGQLFAQDEEDDEDVDDVDLEGDDYNDDQMLDSDEELRSQLTGLTESVKSSLPVKDLPATTLEYNGIVYPMFASDAEGSDQICVVQDKSLIHTEFNIFMGSIRLFLQQKHGSLAFANKEILLEFPDLDLVCDEDNLYIKKMTMDDIISIFKVLRANSLEKSEENVPSALRAVVTLQPRFVSRYNDLVEVMDNNGSFAVARGFSNDESHPVFVDEGNQDIQTTSTDNRNSEIVVMDSDEASLKGSDSDIEILN